MVRRTPFALRRQLHPLALVLLFLLTAASQTIAQRVTTPEEHFGHKIGADYVLPNYTAFTAYFQKLDRDSDRMTLHSIGKTAEGRDQLMAIITSPQNHQNLARYKDISSRLANAEGLTDAQARALAQEGKAVVWIDGGLHATEVLGAQQLIETTYQLLSRNDAETMRILNDVIILVAHANPDGMELVSNWYMRNSNPQERSTGGIPRLYQKYVGHDNNRDFYIMSQPESRNINQILYREWYPQIVYNHHQTGPGGTVMFAPPTSNPFNFQRYPANSDMMAPIAPQAWPFRNSVDYSVTANYAVLDLASRYREQFLHNIWRMGMNSIERGNTDTWTMTPMKIAEVRTVTAPVATGGGRGGDPDEVEAGGGRGGRGGGGAAGARAWELLRRPEWRDPRGFVLPADQPDFPTATKFVNALIRAGITVHRASTSFTVNGKQYPAGSYVVKTAQAFRPHVMDM